MWHGAVWIGSLIKAWWRNVLGVPSFRSNMAVLWQERNFNGLKEIVLEFSCDFYVVWWLLQNFQCLHLKTNTYYTSECPESTQSHWKFCIFCKLNSFTVHKKQYKRAEFILIVFDRTIIETWHSPRTTESRACMFICDLFLFYLMEDIDRLCKTGITNRMLNRMLIVPLKTTVRN